ncbi:MAG TPA: hypothetical protein VKT28_02650 [Puia sp.]|nr:hypothetical protein [Puia sp.]
MAIVAITNGFPNTNGLGIILTVKLIEGEINVRDRLVIDEETKIPIIDIQHFKDDLGAALTIAWEYDNPSKISYQLFNKLFFVESFNEDVV